MGVPVPELPSRLLKRPCAGREGRAAPLEASEGGVEGVGDAIMWKKGGGREEKVEERL
jgi:hypothetical protein